VKYEGCLIYVAGKIGNLKLPVMAGVSDIAEAVTCKSIKLIFEIFQSWDTTAHPSKKSLGVGQG